MDAIRVQQLCRELADLRPGTLWPKCHFLNCFQLCADCMDGIGKLLHQDYLQIETWTIYTWYWLCRPTVTSSIQSDWALCCTAFMMLPQPSASLSSVLFLTIVMCYWLFQAYWLDQWINSACQNSLRSQGFFPKSSSCKSFKLVTTHWYDFSLIRSSYNSSIEVQE